MSDSKRSVGAPAGRLIPYIRAQRDYAVFVTRRFWPLAVGITGLAVGAVTLVSSQWALVLSAAALVTGVGVFIKDAAGARLEWSSYRCDRVAGLFPIREIQDPLGYEGATYLAIPDRGTMLVHQEADRILREGPIPVTVDPSPYRLPEELRRVAPLAIRTFRNGRVIFNGPVVAMLDDLLPASSGDQHPLRLRYTRFFMGLCSSELCQYRLIDRMTGEQTEVRLAELVEPSGRLATLASSGMANAIGISTIAFTTDDVMLVVSQSARNAASPQLLAPSGSGSLEPRDVVAAGPGASLQDVLKRGMEREFAEETGVSTDDVVDTRVLGFGRWLERGARPEFFAVTRLKISSHHPSIARIKPAEAVYSEGVNKIYVDLGQLRHELREGYSIDSAPSCPSTLRGSGSLPLLVGLRAIALDGGEVPAKEPARVDGATKRE